MPYNRHVLKDMKKVYFLTHRKTAVYKRKRVSGAASRQPSSRSWRTHLSNVDMETLSLDAASERVMYPSR